uniref:HNH endonuclease n=1 Tax=Acinetobacter tandoii TaxID=202954 RepID=UPI003F498725
MDVVTNTDQIRNNIKEFEKSKGTSQTTLGQYLKLIQKGLCFVPYMSDSGIAFAPSRFIGYIDNNLEIHSKNDGKNGRETNVAITKIFKSIPSHNSTLEIQFLEFCKNHGVKPNNKKRKYWVTDEIKIIIETDAENEIRSNPELNKTVKQQLINARIGQGNFRKELISMWGKCCANGCIYIDILRASHIKPWRDSTNEERLDKFNGLLLSPNFDALFDKGLISFKDDGKILISKALSNDVRNTLGILKDTKVALQPSHAKYMKWHREKIFIKTL